MGQSLYLVLVLLACKVSWNISGSKISFIMKNVKANPSNFTTGKVIFPWVLIKSVLVVLKMVQNVCLRSSGQLDYLGAQAHLLSPLSPKKPCTC